MNFKHINSHNTLSILFLLIIFSMFAGIIYNKVSIEIAKRSVISITTEPVKTKENWKPVPLERNQIKVPISAQINTLLDFITPFHEQIIDSYGAFSLAINKRIVEDAEPGSLILKLDNGQLSFFNRNKTINPRAHQSILKLNQLCKSNSTNFFCIISPDKITACGGIPYKMMYDYQTEINKLMDALAEDDIHVLDLNKAIQASKIKRTEELFYNTDHHWRIETALKMYFTIQNYFEVYNSSIFEPCDSLSNPLNYESKRITKSFIGSQGRRTGKFFAEEDSFNLITPKYSTHFEIEYYRYGKPIEIKIGDFTGSIINETCFNEGSPYDAYLSGNLPFLKIKNKLKSKGKVLIIKDSFAVPTIAFLASSVNEIQVVDLRYYKENDLTKKIASEAFDCVWLFYNMSSFGAEKSFFDFALDQQ